MNQKTTIVLVLALILGLGIMWWAESSTNEGAEKTSSGPKALLDPPPGDITLFKPTLAAFMAARRDSASEEWHPPVEASGED